MEGVEMIHCQEHNRPVPKKDAVIVTLGENGHNYIIGPDALRQVDMSLRRDRVPCAPDEQGLEFYELDFYQGSVGRGELLFSVGVHEKICLPTVEALLSPREKEKKVA